MHARDIVELHKAANSLEDSIRKAKKDFDTNYPDLDPYTMQYPSGALILAPMLAAQITISNQLDKLVAEHDTTSATTCDGTRRSGHSTEPL